MTSKKIPPSQKGDIEMNLDINEFKEELKHLKSLIQEDLENDSDDSGECGMMVDMIDNLQEDLKGVKNLNSLEGRQKAKIFSQIVAFHQLLESMEDFDDEFEDEFDEEFEFDEAELVDEEEHK